ncbi:4-phosphopantetheinyl transferase family protein [Gramella sp. BOM4]|nr:4-phosphopantetheinyl transferase family protein [Christiangramia bathymodioli]
MIGNDIIDLELAFKIEKSSIPRFLDKVFLAGEQEYIQSSKDPEREIWRLWSMKESAYKAQQRVQRFERRLNPLHFECMLIDDRHGMVFSEENKWKIISDVHQSHIHSFISDPRQHIHMMPKKSRNSKDLLPAIASAIAMKIQEISLEKDGFGIPFIRLLDSNRIIPISLSHHGNFSAFVIPLINS